MWAKIQLVIQAGRLKLSSSVPHQVERPSFYEDSFLCCSQDGWLTTVWRSDRRLVSHFWCEIRVTVTVCTYYLSHSSQTRMFNSDLAEREAALTNGSLTTRKNHKDISKKAKIGGQYQCIVFPGEPSREGSDLLFQSS